MGFQPTDEDLDLDALGAKPRLSTIVQMPDGTDPQIAILLDEKLREGIAAQLRALANLLDPPKGS